MPRKLKVYSWQSFRSECPTHHRQTREIVAAHSKAEASRLAGYTYPSQMFNLGETGNSVEVAIAMAEPGVIFWCPIEESYRSDAKYIRVEPTRENGNA